MPFILQSETSECALAAMVEVASAHGHKIDVFNLRQRFGLSLQGATLKDIVAMADGLGFATRPLRLEIEAVDDLVLPAILHWDMNHFVVLKKVTRSKYVIFDPSRGVLKMTKSEFSKHFTGVALEITPSRDFKPIKAITRTKITSLWTRLFGLKRSLLQILILSIVLQLFVLVSPFYLQLVVDEAIVSADKSFLLLLALGFGALYFFNSLTSAIRSWIMLLIGQSMTFQISGNVLRHMLRLPTDFFEKRQVGDIISRIGSVEPIKTALTQSALAALIDGFMAVTTLIFMLIYDWRLALIAVGITVIYLVLSLILFPILRNRQQKVIENIAVEQSYLIETIRATRPVKIFARQNQRESVWRNLYSDVVNANISYGKLTVGGQFATSLIGGFQTILIVYFGAIFVIDGDLTIGMLFAFMAYRRQFSNVTNALVQKVSEFRMLGLHLERLSDIVQTEKEEGLEVTKTGRQDSPPEIKIQDVSFRYAHNDPYIFENLNLTIQPGEFIAISGASGGGKTTLFKIILGLVLPTTGYVKIDGAPLRSFGIGNWRALTGVVMQDDQLLSGTIAENISFFDSELDMEKVVACAQAAQIDEDVARMPMKYLSAIGEMGSALSGGQKQRLLLARAFYSNPQILLLDEGTANLDEAAEKLIADIITGMDITRIIIAHRPELLERADRVLDMIDGRLVARK
ncbi:MAG: peptidase domain-containing ABC transporter [Hellea sp.]